MTLITHGWNGSGAAGSWVDTMGDAIADRAGSSAAVAQYTLTLTGSGAPTGHSLLRDPNTPAWGGIDNPSGELLIKIDWGGLSTQSSVSTVEVGDAVADILLASPLDGHSVAEAPIHLVGHSRGASLMTQVARRFGERGIWIDQFTSLDPHPVDGVREPFPFPNYGDAPMTLWANVGYADNYWRTNGDFSFDFTGESVNGADNYGPLNLPGGSATNHSDVHAFYHGTIARAATSDGAGGPIEASWYADGAARATGGYDRSRIGRGPRPAAGIGSGFGGAATRTPLTITAPRWYSNVGFLDVTGGVGGLFATGDAITVSYLYQAAHASQPTTVAFFLDTNTNPYDPGALPLGTPQTVAPTGNSNPAAQFAFDWPALPGGQYHVCARITNPDALARYDYNGEPLLVASDGNAKVVTKQWNGAVSSGWADPRNWTPGGVPTGNDRVAIQLAPTQQLDVAGPSASAASTDLLSGTLNWTAGAGTIAGDLNVAGTAVLNITGAGEKRVGSLSLRDASRATLAAGGASVLAVGGLAVADSATLDLADHALVVSNGSLVAVQAAIARGFHAGDWLGTGITSSAAAAHPDASTTLGYLDNRVMGLTEFEGVTGLTGSEVLVKYTYYGDADLTGLVDTDDFQLFLAGYQDSGLPRTWLYGDFDYNGVLDTDDFQVFLYGYQNQRGPL